jgi:general L-amino acid transport system permease protein
VDQASAALVMDLKQRGLLEDTLVVWGGEFGRTPMVEASAALGLSRSKEVRLVLLPQALRVIIPPVTSQYLNLTKNSSLAVAVGYPDLVSISTTSLNQTGRAIECIALIMACYLTLSLLTSWFMNAYNRRSLLKER